MNAPAGPKPASAATRFADRALCVVAAATVPAGAILGWFGVVRVDHAGPSYWALVSLPIGLSLVAIAFLALRSRVYRRVQAPKLLVAAAALGLPALALEGVANVADPGGYLYFAHCQRYFAGQRYQGVLPDHVHPAGYELEFPWGAVSTNSEGWRGPERALEAPEGAVRILGLGDSVLFSWGVDDAQALDRQLEADLVGRGHPQVEVLNTGNGSFNSLDELLVLRSRGLAYRPDLAFVIVIGNDFVDRPPFVDQIDWLEREGFHDPTARDELRAGQAQRPTLTGPQAGFGRWLYLSVSQLVNRSFLIVSGAKAIMALRSGSTEPTELTGATPPPPSRPPQQEGSPGEPSGGPSTPPDAPVPSVSGSPVASPQPIPPPEALRTRYPYLIEQTAALRELVATCRAEKVPLVVFTFTDNLGDRDLNAHLEQALSGAQVVPLHYPEGRDPIELANSFTDRHWNPEAIAHFAERIGSELDRALASR